jgi:hypothetical protein
LSPPKVFCIGLNKTGTSSLAQALRMLGYRVTGPNFTQEPDLAHTLHRRVREVVPQYDAFQDMPWPMLYAFLDAEYPGSKFILTVRDPEAWIRSQVRHFGTRTTPMREWAYGAGCPAGNEARYLEVYRRHNAAVRAHFRGRPEAFLEMDLAAGDGWEALCGFLERRRPMMRPFPHANPAWKRSLRGWKRVARAAVGLAPRSKRY